MTEGAYNAPFGLKIVLITHKLQLISGAVLASAVFWLQQKQNGAACLAVATVGYGDSGAQPDNAANVWG
jgi:hypothetical protein